MTEPLPHHAKLAEMEFVPGVMPKTENALRRLALDISQFQSYTVQQDLDDLADDLQDGEWAQLTQAADASLAQVIFNNLSATQKEVLRSLLAEN